MEHEKQTDEKIERALECISEYEGTDQKVLFDGQIYDALSLIVRLIQKAEKEIMLVDGYVDVGTLNLFSNVDKMTIDISYETGFISLAMILFFLIVKL